MAAIRLDAGITKSQPMITQDVALHGIAIVARPGFNPLPSGRMWIETDYRDVTMNTVRRFPFRGFRAFSGQILTPTEP